MPGPFETLESTLQPVADAILPDDPAATVTGAIDAATARARELAGDVSSVLGELAGVTEDALKALSDTQQTQIAELLEATKQMRSAADTLRGMLPGLDPVARKPLWDKLAAENLIVVGEAAKQCRLVAGAVITVFARMKPLITPFPAIVTT